MPFWFFTSYARADRDSYMEQFFTDLRKEVRNILGGSPDNITFVDTQSIETGDEWEPRMAQALQTSRICVALCSRSYFNSTYCGKEYKVFLDRHEASSGSHSIHRVIFPVLWVPPRENLPEVVTRFQYTHADFPDVYAQEGLHYIMKLKRHEDEYHQLVLRLAQKLVDAGNAIGGLNTNIVRPLREVPSAFHNPALLSTGSPPPLINNLNNASFVFVVARRGELQGVRRSLDAYHESTGWGWQPYHPHADISVGLVAQEVASRLKFRYLELEMEQDLIDKVRELERANQIVVFVTDAWSVRLPRYAGPMRNYDQAMLSNCAFLVAWNDSDPETNEHHVTLKQDLCRIFPRKTQLCPPSHHWEAIRSEKDLREKLEKALTEVRMTILQIAGVLRKAENAELKQTAEEQGIILSTKPNLTGPGGPR